MQFTINPFTHRLDAFEQNTPAGADVEWLSGNVGGKVGPDAGANVNVIGGGAVTVTGTPLTNTLAVTVAAGGLVWTRDALAAVVLGADEGHIPTNVGLTTYTLPATAALGTVIKIVGESAGLWAIAQNAGQSIQVGNVSTTPGVGGSITATNQYDTIELICRVVNTTWSADGFVGILNIV